MNTQHQVPYMATSPHMTRNGSHASLPDNDSWESYLHLPFESVYGESQLYHRNPGQDFNQSDTLMPNWAPEDQDDPTYTHAVDLNTSSPPIQSPETRVQPGAIGFGKTNGQKNFVRKLYDMLSDESANAYIYWNSDGKSFTIENQEVFAKNVLKNYLKTDNFQSFIRQLNMYDFHKINRAQRAQRGVQSQSPQYVFSHTKFRRDEPDLLSEIKRKGTEQPDAPPQYDTLLPASRFGLGTLPCAQPFAAVQPDIKASAYQAEIQRLQEQLGLLQAAYAKLHHEHDSLKARLQVRTMSIPQLQNAPSSLATSYQAHYDEKTSDQACSLFEPGYAAPAPQPTEAPMVFHQFTGITDQSSFSQALPTTSTSHRPLESTPIRRRSSNARASDISANPQQAQEEPRSRPSSWYGNVGQWLCGHIPVVGSNSEPGPSAPVNTFPQDYATYNLNHGKSAVGGRAQPVVVAKQRRHF